MFLYNKMTNWYNNYASSYNCNININNYLDILTKNINNQDNNNIENKIHQIEIEYQTKLNELNNLFNNTYLIENIKNKNSLEIIQKELDIIKLLTKYCLQNKKIDYLFFMNCLNIILEFSEILRNRLEQKKINNILDVRDNDKIQRCSYKFCSYQDNCVYNYNLKIKKLCYQDHYVHNMVSSDIINVINYINNKYKDVNIILHNKEILKTINTLSFVIGHMEQELRTKCLYLPESEWENNHIVKNKNCRI
jgi:hypothetical protein